MASDDFLLQRGEEKKFPGILQSNLWMGKAMESGVGVGLVPVIEKQVMEQPAAGCGIKVQPQNPAKQVAYKSYGKAVLQGRNIPMLGKLLHHANTRRVNQAFDTKPKAFDQPVKHPYPLLFQLLRF